MEVNDTSSTPSVSTNSSSARIGQAKEVVKSVSLDVSSIEEDGEVIVTISIQNPENKPVTSAQTWLAYNPESLVGKTIDFENSAFELAAPYATEFDPVNGLISIGRSTSMPITDSVIEVAKVIFEKTAEGATMLDVYDYRPDLSGHFSVNMMLEGTPYNILKNPDTPVLIIN